MFGARFVLTPSVESLTQQDDLFRVQVSGQGTVRARAVVLACGVAYRRLGVPDVEAFTGHGVYYGASVSAAHSLTGLSAAVVGGGNSAGQAVLQLARYCSEVHLVVRGPRLSDTMSAYLVEAVAGEPVITVHLSSDVTGASGAGRLEHLVLTDRETGATKDVDVDGLFVMIGAAPHTDWLPADVRRDRFGFVLTGVDATDASGGPRHPHETSVPGIFAVGDVRSGSVKRVASAVGEGSVVVSEVHQHLSVPHG
jgi:thioredoxin reductase (NADPH)